MIYDKDDFEVKYWGGDFVPYNEDFTVQKSFKNLKRNILILASFLTILVLIPAIIYSVSKIQVNESSKIAISNQPALENKKTVNQNTQTYNDKSSSNKESEAVEIINNDSYWKISKRTCGEGKYYLSIAYQNNNKALYKGDTVTVSCKLN